MESLVFSFTLLLIVAGALSAAAGVMAVQRREAAAAPAVVVCMAAGTWWALSYALLLQGAPPSPRFWLTAMFVGVILTPPAFLIFALLFAEKRRWLNRATLGVLTLQPIVVLPVLFTDAHHHLFFGPLDMSGEQPFHGGPVFWLNALYAYVVDVLAFLILVGAYRRAAPLQKRQAGILLMGALVPSVLNVFSLMLLTPTTNLDATPIGFAVTGMAMVYNLRRQGLFDLIPIARHEVFNHMSDGALVLDREGRVIDVNPAAGQLLSLTPATASGEELRGLLDQSAFATNLLALTPGEHRELRLDGNQPLTLDVRATALHTEKTRFPSLLLVLRDVTDLKRAEHALREQLAENEALQRKLRQEAIRDPLTGLYNRRFLEETLDRELARARRHGHAVAVALLDIDYFKRFNDRFGHQEGDRVLQSLAGLLQEHARSGDAACRYGGEEFVMVFPDADLEVVEERMNALRVAFAVADPDQEGVRSSFSGGIAAFPDDGADAPALLKAADRALYAAKGAGRNRVVLARAAIA
ncbi:diguanylate cyclase [Ectothiorhodospiraceae bacterium WFHF3C12]|nr:diguanylate cyclase [Ectothiorhodospiraceae bacterium WFHF3C12]